MNTLTSKPPVLDRAPALRDRETILVVDDQPALCEVADILLTRCGYRVITANDALQAKKLARQNPRIDLLLTDVEMPGMLGDELAEWFRVSSPQTAIVFMSGSSMQRLRLKEYPCIEKPFVHLDALVQIIRDVLAQNRDSRLAAALAAA